MEDLPELPPLPMGEDWEYTPEEMREYARKAVLLERERCAKLCDELSRMADDSEGVAWSVFADAAAAIRSSGGGA
jgi:DNA-directed RNA polymerase subunit F